MSDPERYGRRSRSSELVTPGSREPKSFPASVGLTIAGVVIPGLGLLLAGRRRLGILLLSASGIAAAAVALVGTIGRQTVLRWAVQPSALLVMALLLIAAGAAWGLVAVATHHVLLRPRVRTRLQRLVSGCVVTALVFAVVTPLTIGGRYALIQRNVIEHVFANSAEHHATSKSNSGDRAAQTARPAGAAPAALADPWSGKDRVNVLLLGGDAGPDRHGVRPDTLIVASIDTAAGATVLFSVPRNLQQVPFQPGSALAKAHPNGIYGGAKNDQEWMVNSIYENVPDRHPGLLTGPNPGAEATKLAVAGALGIPIDYYVLVNLRGFIKLIDALGGITVNVNQRVAVGGEATAGLKPHRWIEKGPNQHFDGFDALWFARGRYGASDWDRMIRQRCVIKAIIDQANPLTLLTRYEALATASKDILTTDIPTTMLPAFVDLAHKVKQQADITSVAFVRRVINPGKPDYPLIQGLVQDALLASRGEPAAAKSVEGLDTACAYTGQS